MMSKNLFFVLILSFFTWMSVQAQTDSWIHKNRKYKGGIQDGYMMEGHDFYVEKAVAPVIVCEGDKAVLTVEYDGTFAYRYEWHKYGVNGALTTNDTLTLDSVTIANRGKYFCSVIDIRTGITKWSDTVDLQIRKNPKVMIDPDSSRLMCWGDTIILNASGSEAGKESGDSYTYSWTGPSIVTPSNQAVISVAPRTSGKYVVTVDNQGCQAMGEVWIDVYRPEINLPDYVYISEGNTLELTANAPTGAYLVWEAESNVFTGINPFRYPNIRNSMEVKVKMVNEGCEAEDICKVYVKRGRGYKGGMQDGYVMGCMEPTIVTQDRSVASCESDTAELNIVAEGSTLKYIWQKYNTTTKEFEDFVPPVGSSVEGLGSHNLKFTPLTLADNGMYMCKLQNDCGTVLSDTFYLSVGGRPVFQSRLNKDWGRCANTMDSTHLNVVVVDPLGGELKYSWYKVDTMVSPPNYTLLADTHTYNKPYLKLLLNQKEKEGIYLVSVKNVCGDARDSVFIPVNTPIRITYLNVEKPGNIITGCIGQSVEFYIETQGGGTERYYLKKVTKVHSQIPLKYDAEFVKGGASNRLFLNKLEKADEGWYVWEVENECGKDTSDFINLRIDEPPVITSISDTLVSLCERESTVLKCEGTSLFPNLTYEWYKNGIATGIKNTTCFINNATETDAGNYTCWLTNSCPGVESPVIHVEVKKYPGMAEAPRFVGSNVAEKYCEGDTVVITASVPNIAPIDSMRWFCGNVPVMDIPGRVWGSTTDTLHLDSVIDADKGIYRLVTYNECGETKGKTHLLSIDLPARFVKDMSDYTDLLLCDGDNQALAVLATGTPPIRYRWIHNQRVVAQGTKSMIELKNATVDTSGVYCCEIQNGCGGEITCATIKVTHPDTFRFELSSPTNILCASDTVNLTAVLKGSDTTTIYSLYKKSVPDDSLVMVVFGGDIWPKGGFIEFMNLRGGVYYVEADQNGCKYRMPGEVEIIENPNPTKFDLFISKHFCKGLHLADLSLKGSENDLMMEYQLQKWDGTQWVSFLNSIRGTGDTLIWTDVTEGTYKVVTTNLVTGCQADMTGIVEVIKQELPVAYPLVAKDDDSVYCANAKADVVLILQGAEPMTKYSLLKSDGSVYKLSSMDTIWNEVEAGVYYVRAENQWGCVKDMGRQSVITQKAPDSTSITGGFIYCRDQRDSATIELPVTQEGILYKVFRDSPKELYVDTMGTGANIVLKVPMEEKRYYVLAQDTTVEHCSVYLSDTAVFRMSRLKVVGNPSEVYIPNGTSTQLYTVVTGAVGDVTYKWEPAGKLVPGEDTVANPHTVTLTNREDYRVTVKDQSGCIADTLVSVIMKDGKLSIDIRKPDKVTPVDTLHVCADEKISLYAWVNGGTGIYSYRWWDEFKDTVSKQQLLTGYFRATDGWLHLDVKSGDITESDSVWVKVYDNPQQFALMDTGLVCVQAGSTYQIELTGGEPGVDYILSYSSNGFVFTDIDTIHHASASRVIFSLANAAGREGYYRIRAKLSYVNLVCWTEMEGEVNIRRAPKIFVVSEDREYCEGERVQDSVWLSGSEKGVSYALYRLSKEFVLGVVMGSGDSLLFSDDYGTGEYYVMAKQGVCEISMKDTIQIKRNPLPAKVNMLDKGGYCNGGCPEKIRIAPAVAGVDYVLNRIQGGTRQTLEMINGIDTIAFGTYCQPGEYYVESRDQKTGCERENPDRLRLSGTLEDRNVTSEAFYCDSEWGYKGLLKVFNPQDGVEYKLYTVLNNLEGEFDSVAVDGLYLRGNLPAGDYIVKASNDSCKLQLSDTVHVKKLTLPKDSLLPDYTLCEGEGQLLMSVITTKDYHYELWRDSSKVNGVLEEKVSSANGQQINMGPYGEVGTYFVKVKDTVYGCEWQLPGNFRIYDSLKEFDITGNTSYCAVDGGVVIGISGTEDNVKYVLERKLGDGGYEEVTDLRGGGLPVVFDGKHPKGEYRVKAVRGCEKWMNGTLVVEEKDMPSDSTTLALIGNGCADSTVIIRVHKTEMNVEYTLQHESMPILNMLSGTGDSIQWNITPAQLGEYKVIADKDGCIALIKPQVKIGERPFVSEVFGDTLLCANETGELYLNSWDKKAVYTLHKEDGEKVLDGKVSGGKMRFTPVPVGSFYVEAERGNCVVKGEIYTIDSLPVPVLDSTFWEVSDCILRDSGFIHITGMVDSLSYVLTNSSLATLMNYRGVKSDTLFKHLSADEYCVVAKDEKNGCVSDALCEEIREGVTADSLIGDFAYCGDEGVKLRLSGSSRNMKYSILDSVSAIEEIYFPTTVFSRIYKEGKYIFRKERTGFAGGCFEEDTIVIKQYNYPKDTFRVEVRTIDSILCAEQDYLVDLYSTEAGYRYILVKDSATVEFYLDTVVGGGNPVTYDYLLRESGYYRIYEELLDGGCGRYGDSTLKVMTLPSKIKVENCTYCVGGSVTVDSCQAQISGLTNGVKYIFRQDTVFGPSPKPKVLSPAPAGEYFVMAEDLYTHCKDTVGKVVIKANIAPKVFTVDAVCDTIGHVRLIDGCEQDSVDYYLYKDGSMIAGPLKDTNSTGIDFGEYDEYGVYKIKAVNKYGCEIWMRDSATIFEKLSDGELKVDGRYCENDTTKGVVIKYTKSSKGWKYYLKKGPWMSDTLVGTGAELSWNSINRRILSQGKYELYTMNACADNLIASVWVDLNPLPTKFKLDGDMNEVVCVGGELPIKLKGSETGVTYYLVYKKDGSVQKLDTLLGTGYELDFSYYSAIGQYIVYGEVDSSGCWLKMDEKLFSPGKIPEKVPVKGNDVCLGVDKPEEVAITLDGKLQAGVRYILLYSGGMGDVGVDTLMGTTVFTVQTDTGCYHVLAEDTLSGCQQEMDSVYCIGNPPEKPQITDVPTDTIVLCRGEEYCIGVDTTMIGVKYRLLRNGNVFGAFEAGTGWGGELESCADETGIYKVEAYVGDGHCRAVSDDSVIVKVNELPGLILTREYEYCEYGKGVQITVEYPTYIDFTYNLYSPAYVFLETMVGDTNHMGFTFTGNYTDSGYYYIKVVAPTSCVREDSVEVKVNKLPEPYPINSTNGKYLCVDGLVDIFLENSELNIEYFLYRERLGVSDTLLGQKFGTGDKLVLATVGEVGIYKVIGRNIYTYCENNMLQKFELLQADTVRVYPLEGITTGYCGGDDRKGSLRLINSQIGVRYELYRDGDPMNMVQFGTGGELLWLGLDGKPCSNLPGIEDKGYIYEIKGTDTLTDCGKWMKGQVGIVEEVFPQIMAYHPNKDISRCEGDTVHFSLTAQGCGLNYTWMRDGVVVKDTTEAFYNIDTVKISDYGMYNCVVSNTCGSVSTPGVPLQVWDSVKMVQPMEDIAVCGNVKQDLILTAYILNGTSHEWYKIVDGEPEMVGNNSWYKLTNVTQADTGVYIYSTRSHHGCGEMTDTCRIYVDENPVVSAPPFRTDTICAGSTYTLTVNSPDSVKWYHDNVFTGVIGNVFRLDSVVVEDEGRYTVRVVNACGMNVLDVAHLYVDDTIRVVNLHPGGVVCSDDSSDLYIITNPEKRVEYTWECAGLILKQGEGKDYASIKVGPMSLSDPEYTYFIRYKNRCSLGESVIRMHVGDTLVFEDLQDITVCAEAGKDTFIYVKHTPVGAVWPVGYQWYYHKLKEDASPLELEGERSDTLWLPMSTSVTGFYFCKFSEVCNPVTTRSSWVRVDSIPVLLNNLQSDTLCEGNDLALSLSATGGQLHFDWTICYKDGTVESFNHLQSDFECKDDLNISNLTVLYDSCRIWCHIYNHCDPEGVYSDTMLLRIDKQRSLWVEPGMDVTLCRGDASGVNVKLHLVDGALPWSFKYTTPDSAAEHVVTGIMDTVYILNVKDSGDYVITYLTDTIGCIFTDNLPVIHAKYTDPASLIMSGSQSVCYGDTARVHFSIIGGVGPWKVQVVDILQSALAEELCGDSALVMTGRDTIIAFLAERSSEYSVQSFFDMGTGCNLALQDSMVIVNVSESGHINFNDGPWYVGQCHNVNLRNELKPMLNDTTALPASGHFFINGIDRGTSGVILKADLRGDSCYRVRC
uniref:immunoglobulin domain-containing protein n=1 Tax=Odoribacter lunatus TaxID=2941335 RepID=UPI00203ABAE4